MMFAELAIVFVGLAGNHHEAVEHQLGPVLEKAGVTELAIPDKQLAAIARTGDSARDAVRSLHVDGVISGALINSGGHTEFRLVIYDGEGNLRSRDETPLPKKKLTKDDLEVIASNLGDEVESLAKRAHHDAPAIVEAPKPAPVKAPPPPAPTPAPPPAKLATSAPTSGLAEVTFGRDDEAPPSLGGGAPPAPTHRAAPAAPVADPEPAQPAHHEAAPVETADAVSLDEIEALTGGNEVTADTGSSTASSPLRDLHLHAGLAFGLVGRVFSSGSTAVSDYSSKPVGAVGFDVGVRPTERIALEASAERTIQMSSSVNDGMASTTISRWQATGSIAVVRGSFELAPVVGIGHRTFSIDSTDPSRSPDGDYSYLVLGTSLGVPVGAHTALRGLVALEPVIGGKEPTEMAFGDATRWALDVGAAIELHPITHVFVRAAAELQRFSWSWDAAGARGAGGASDLYPSASLALGADY